MPRRKFTYKDQRRVYRKIFKDSYSKRRNKLKLFSITEHKENVLDVCTSLLSCSFFGPKVHYNMRPTIFWNTLFGWNHKYKIKKHTDARNKKKRLPQQSLNQSDIQDTVKIKTHSNEMKEERKDDGVVWKTPFEARRKHLQKIQEKYWERQMEEWTLAIQEILFPVRKYKPRYKLDSDKNHDFSEIEYSSEDEENVFGPIPEFDVSSESDNKLSFKGGIAMKDPKVLKTIFNFQRNFPYYKHDCQESCKEYVLVVGLDSEELEF